MTQIHSSAPPVTPMTRAQANTIYRDAPMPSFGMPAVRLARQGSHALETTDAGGTGAILVGLAALIVPTAVYSFIQLASMITGGSLDHAVRAFLP